MISSPKLTANPASELPLPAALARPSTFQGSSSDEEAGKVGHVVFSGWESPDMD